MKVYLSGVNPENRISDILGELGHEVLVPTEAERCNPNEFTPYSKIRESDAVLCDMTVVMGIDDHRMAFALGKPILSLRPRKNSGDGLSSFIREVSRVVYFTDGAKLKVSIDYFLKSLKPKTEHETSSFKERR